MRLIVRSQNIDLPKDGRSIEQIVSEAVTPYFKHFKDDLIELTVSLKREKDEYQFSIMTNYLTNSVVVTKTTNVSEGLVPSIKAVAKKAEFDLNRLKEKQDDKNTDKKHFQEILEFVEEKEERKKDNSKK